MLFVEDDELVQTLSAERPDDSFDDGIRPRARYGCGNRIDTDPSGALAEVASVHRVVIMEQMTWLGGHVDVHQLAPAVGDEHEHVRAS